jgi:hypothetical protein
VPLERVIAALAPLVRALALAGAVASCGKSDPVATFVQPVYREPCRFTDCGPGICTPSDTGAPSCLCDPGYQGPLCGSCEPGFHRDHFARCLPDTRCADQPHDPCGAYGSCDDATGVVTCSCDEGYEGPRCTLCADRYGRDALGRCLPIYLGGDAVGQTAAPVECKPGYAGSDCTSCADGYHAFGPGCVVDERCEPGLCPASADCRILEGVRSCLCRPGYSGAGCDQCASGFHAVAGVCVVDASCDTDTCPAQASCSLDAGEASCTCVAGYTGDDCADCVTGYHVEGNDCVPDELCSPLECSARATCVVISGQIRCDCDPGWGGTLCDRCVDLGTEVIGFEGATDWPTVSNTCRTRDELWVPRLSLRSRAGAEPLLLCASNTYSGLTSQHVELRAGRATAQSPALPAELVFWQPVVMVSFDYAATLEPIALDVFADDAKVGSLSIAAFSRASFTTLFDKPVTTLTLVSHDGTLQGFGLDNLVFNYERCR